MHENIEKNQFYKDSVRFYKYIKMHENIEKNQFYKDSVCFYKFILIETNTIFIKLIFSMFSCILSFVGMPMVLPTY